MLEQQSSSNNERRRLSLITDILILIPFIIATFIVLKSVNISQNIPNESDSVEILSLESHRFTIDDENELYIKNIKNEFGIYVLYGKAVEPFSNRLEATAQYNKNIINNNLKIIYESLKKYPIEVFNMSLSKENPTYIMIVDHFENNNLALASRNNLDEYRIYISNAEKLERAFHHEMYHVLEYYMSKNKNVIYSKWSDLNPKDFKYNKDTSKLDKKYVYEQNNEGLNNKQSIDNEYYFVTKYSKTTEKEDRAEIFAELMTLVDTPSYLKEGQKIREKVDYILETIGDNITENDFYCNQYIK